MSIASRLAGLIVPLNLAAALLVLALLLGLLALHRRHRRWARRAAVAAVACALAWMLAWSLPVTSLWAGGRLEQAYPQQAVAALPEAQAIVVLGGHTANGRPNWFLPYDRDTAVPRTDTALQLYAAGRAPLIVVSGAALDGGVSEAHLMARALEADGVPPAAIVQETRSFTTHENAVYTMRLLRARNIDSFFLVTSALHMPRAMASFEALGAHPTAVPAAPQITVPAGADARFWLPQWRSLQASRTIIKEYLGRWVYALRGWA